MWTYVILTVKEFSPQTPPFGGMHYNNNTTEERVLLPWDSEHDGVGRVFSRSNPFRTHTHRRIPSQALQSCPPPFCLQTPFQRSSFPPVFHSHSHQIPKPTLVDFYPPAGQLREIQGGRFQLHRNSMGARLLEAVSVAKLDDFTDFRPNQDVEQLFPKIDHDLPLEEIPLLLVQLTNFRCGVLTLGIDGVSVVLFVNSWARITSADLSSSEMLLRDSTILDSRKPCTAPRFDHPEFSPPPLWESCLVETEDHEDATAILEITRDQVQKLKEKASDFDPTPRPYTSSEVISRCFGDVSARHCTREMATSHRGFEAR